MSVSHRVIVVGRFAALSAFVGVYGHELDLYSIRAFWVNRLGVSVPVV